MRSGLIAVGAAAILALAACGSDAPEQSEQVGQSGESGQSDPGAATTEQRYPDVLAAELSEDQAGTFTVSVTMSSPYDTPQRYADGWRVLAPDGTELGTHQLGHDHASEQPFTRTQSGLSIPSDVAEVTVEGRDQEYGYGGATVTVPVP